MRFIQAKNYTAAARTDISLIVLHSMESQEKPGTALAVALWFAGQTAPRASAHYCIDSGEVVQCVRDEDIAWHAPGANTTGIGLEHAGRAAQTSAEWADPYSKAMMDLSAELCATLCRKWKIPAVLVGEAGLRSGARGITTHAAVSRTFKKSTHTDPGRSFPLVEYVWQVGRSLRFEEDL